VPKNCANDPLNHHKEIEIAAKRLLDQAKTAKRACKSPIVDAIIALLQAAEAGAGVWRTSFPLFLRYYAYESRRTAYSHTQYYSLFRPLPDCVSEADDLRLKVSVDRSIHFYFYLKERFDPKARPNGSQICDIRIDLASYVEFFDRLGSATMREVVVKQLEWKWEAPKTSTALRDRFFEHFDALRKKTPRLERYRRLMQLIKPQLFNLAFTFIYA